MPRRYYGTYAGICTDNHDPLSQGRIRVSVPEVHGESDLGWAQGCFPLAGGGSGLYGLPPVGAQVWVTFEGGAPNRPVWLGGAYSSTDPPPAAQGLRPGVSGMTFTTERGHSLTVSDAPGADGGIVIRSASGATIRVGDAGITISNEQGAVITLTGPTVDVNGGALTVV